MKEVVLSKVYKYLKIKLPNISNRLNKYFTCPKCKSNKITCNVIKKHPDFIIGCIECNFVGNILDVVRVIEEEKSSYSDEDIMNYLCGMFKIPYTYDTSPSLINKYLNFYLEKGFDLLPIKTNDKIPIQKAWTTTCNKNINTWIQWLKNGSNIGVKTGKASNITVIDIDNMSHLPEVFKKYTNLVYQNTNRGRHYYFKYEPLLPKTNLRNKNIDIDIENDGGQVVICPSIIDGIQRLWPYSINELKFTNIPEMPKDILEFLINNINKTKNNNEQSLKEENTEESFLIKEGSRNNNIIKIAGILRKKLNIEQTNYTLNVLNNMFCNPKLPQIEIKNICSSIDKYVDEDSSLIGNRILKYLEIAEEATDKDLMDVLKETRERIKISLSDLLKEEKIFKSRTLYKINKKATWKSEFVNEGIPFETISGKDFPYIGKYVTVRYKDLITIGGYSGTGKTHVAMNIIKKLRKEHNIIPHYISLEAGSRFSIIAQKIGLIEGDFLWTTNFNPEEIELEDNSVTIIDWLLPKDFTQTSSVLQQFTKQLQKHGGILIVFVQLRNNGEWFAKDQLEQFPSYALKFLYDSEDNRVYSHFLITKAREGKFQGVVGKKIPLKYDWHTKELICIEEEENEDYKT